MLLRRQLPSISSRVALPLATATTATAVCSTPQRNVGIDLSLKAGQLRDSEKTPENIAAKEIAVKTNNEIVEALQQNMSLESVQYRKTDRPWEVVPQFMRRRVTDMVGILESVHRMEMEQIIERISLICDIDVHIVIVPTVGYVRPRVFAQSVFYDWGIGEPKGNGLLLVISQQDGSVQSIASPALQHYFADQFLDLIVNQVLKPVLRETCNPSYAILQTTYTAAQYIDEMRPQWEQNRLVPLHVENKLRHIEKTIAYGIFHTSSFWFTIFGTFVLVWLINRILDLYCPECGEFMHHVKDDKYLEKMLSKGQWLEHKNECTTFRVHRCPKAGCEGIRIRVIWRDLYQEKKCLPCEDCKFRTMTLDKQILRLPTKTEDGLKQFYYECENCNVVRDVRLPLLRPLEDTPNDDWYSNLLQRAANPMGEKKRQKLI